MKINRFIVPAVIWFVSITCFADVQDDINALGPNGGTVIIPAGINTVTSSIIVPDNVLLVGQCVNSVLKAGNGLNGPIISNADQTLGNSGIRLKGFSIDGNKQNQSAGNGIHLARVTDVSISDVKVHNCYGSGIYLGADSTDIRIDSCLIHDNGYAAGDGIQAAGPNLSNLSVMNCTIHSNHDNGINGSGSNFRLMGNYVYNHQTGDDGLKLVNASGLLITCNRIDGAGNSAVEINTANDFVVLGNYVTNATGGLDVRSSEDFILNGNLSRNNTSGITISSGASPRSGALVSNNICVENLSQGIFSHGMNSSIFSANLNANNGSTNGEHYGMYIRGVSGDEVSNVLINANETVETRTPPNNNQQYGLRVEHMNKSLISDNISKGAGLVDVTMGPGNSSLTVTDNLFDSEYVDGAAPGSCADVINSGFSIESDINGDCYVDLQDIAQISSDWLKCNDPTDIDCEQNWPL